MITERARGCLKKVIRESFPSLGVAYDYVQGAQRMRNIGDRVPALTTLDLSRKADTFHILGTGPSINKIQKATWEQIRMGESFGLNFFVCHDFVADFLSIELDPYQSKSEGRDAFFRILRSRVDELASHGSLIIFKLAGYPLPKKRLILFLEFLYSGVPEKLRPNVRICGITKFNPVNELGLSKTINFIQTRGMDISGNSRLGFAQIRGSVIWAVLIGIRMNYPRVVLSGFDMTGGDHFYQQKGSGKFVHDRYFDSMVSPNMHATADPSLGRVTVPVILESLRGLAEQRGVSLLNGTPNFGSPLDNILDPWNH